MIAIVRTAQFCDGDSGRIDRRCLDRQATRPWTHDNLFHTTLGLLDVQTKVYDPTLDIAAACRVED